MAAFLAESRSKSFCQPCSHPLHHPAEVKKVHMVDHGYFTLPSNSYAKQVLLMWCYKGRFATTIFSATQHCSVGTMLQAFKTMSLQCCNAVLCWNSSLRIVPCNITFRDLTIRQRRRPWKRPWKIDSASFQTISRSSKVSKVSRLFKRGEFMLELKRGGLARVQTQRVEFIALPFPFSKQIKIWAFHVVVVQGRLRNVQKSVMHVQSCYFAN